VKSALSLDKVDKIKIGFTFALIISRGGAVGSSLGS
jgi:hypothetical protein